MAKTIEFVSLKEAFEFGKVVSYKYTENGVLCEIDTKEESKPQKAYYVYTQKDGSVLYACSGGVSFSFEKAAVMSEKDAKRKAFFMTKNGTYEWRVAHL